MKNIRFWIHNPANVDGGFVKLTLKPGQMLTWGYSCTTDEGWSSHYENWHFDAGLGVLFHNVDRDGADCDGRLSSGSVRVCPIADLAAEAPNDYCQEHYDCKGVMLPAWVREDAWRRDYAAEAAGY